MSAWASLMKLPALPSLPATAGSAVSITAENAKARVFMTFSNFVDQTLALSCPIDRAGKYLLWTAGA